MKSILLTSSSSSDSSTSSSNLQTSNNLLLLADDYNNKEHSAEIFKEESAQEILDGSDEETIFRDIFKKQKIKSNKSIKSDDNKLKRSDRIESEKQQWQKTTHSDVNSDYYSLSLESHPLIAKNNVIVDNESSDNLCSSRGEKLIPSVVTQVNSTSTTATKLINLRKKNGTTLIFQRKNCSPQQQQQTPADFSEYQELEIESLKKRQSLHWPLYKSAISNHAKSQKPRHYSWHDNYSKHSIEEEFENSSLTHFENEHNNLAETIVASSLLSVNNTANDENVPENNIIMKTSTDNSIAATPPTTGATSKRWHNIEQFLKSLVGKRSSSQTPSSNTVVASSVIEKVNNSPSTYDLLLHQQQKSSGAGGSDESGSTISLNRDRLIDKSTTSLNSTSLALVHQKLWSVVPLLSRKDGSHNGAGASCNNLLLANSSPPHGGRMRKCETVLVLTDEKLQQRKILQASTSKCNRTHSKSINNLLDHPAMPIRPLNRLRNSQSCYVNCDSNAVATTRQTQTCSRCSSLLSLAAIGGSSYSLKNGAFVLKNGKHLNRHANKRLLDEVTSEDDSSSNHNLIENDFNSIEPYETNDAIRSALKENQMGISLKFTCKLCLGEYYNEDKLTTISSCGCIFCTECMRTYVEFEISEGAYELSCPDALCSSQGVISLAEISQLASTNLVAKHHRYRLNREVELDKNRLWCPNRNCETICSIPTNDKLSPSTSSQSAIQQQQPSSSTANLLLPRSVLCPSCSLEFCSSCKKAWHPQITCDENSKRLGSRNDSLMLFDNDLIKMCPMCSVPIEKDEGCAQMMCKRCKHVFCWYCLASLDDDFLLRHYDKGPCKNKLGHSRASVVWHRAQVIGIFAGFGILLLVASPLLLLAAPCIVCCKCKIEESTTTAKVLDEPDHHSDHQV